jgi:hypothetical protein
MLRVDWVRRVSLGLGSSGPGLSGGRVTVGVRVPHSRGHGSLRRPVGGIQSRGLRILGSLSLSLAMRATRGLASGAES